MPPSKLLMKFQILLWIGVIMKVVVEEMTVTQLQTFVAGFSLSSQQQI
jgi:hypothetical protein